MVADIRRVRLAELFYNEQGDRFYKAKVCYISLDEKSGVEKRTAVQMLAQASSVREALDRIDEGMKGSMADYEVAAITESPLVDVFPFSEGAKARQGRRQQRRRTKHEHDSGTFGGGEGYPSR